MSEAPEASGAGPALTIPPVESLISELLKREDRRLDQKKSVWPRRNPILSDIGDCDRQIVYGVTNWQDKPPPDSRLAARFEVGDIWEREMVKQLLDMGFDFQGGQQAVQIMGRGGVLLATGKVDGFIRWEGKKIPVEFKSMHPNVFNAVRSVEDFQKKPWLRKYIRQLMMYLYGNNIEYGIFGCTDCLGGKKWFALYLDLGECEALLQRLEGVQKHLAAKTLPDRIMYDEPVCGSCAFNTICLNDVIRDQAAILSDPDLITMLEEREKLAEPRKRYEDVDEEIKERFKGLPRALVGDWVIIGREMQKVASSPDPSKPKIVYWKTDIKRLADFTPPKGKKK